MKTIQSQSTSNPCTVSQYAALAALTGSQDCVGEMTRAFRERHDLVVTGLNAIEGLLCRRGEGTFYVLPDASGLIERLGFADDDDLCRWLLSETGLAVVPGSAFGAPGHFRLSFATGSDTLRAAITRLSDAIS